MDASSTASAWKYLICAGDEDATIHILPIMVKDLQKETVKMLCDFVFCFDLKLPEQYKSYHHGFWCHFYSKNSKSPIT